MDHVRLLSIQAVEHSAYTTSMEKFLKQAFISNRLKVYNELFSVVKSWDKPRRRRQGNKRNQNRDRSSKGREKERRGGRGKEHCNCKLHHLVL